MIPYAGAAFASICRVSSLYDEVLLNVKEGAVRVIVDLAELYEVLAKQWASFDCLLEIVAGQSKGDRTA